MFFVSWMLFFLEKTILFSSWVYFEVKLVEMNVTSYSDVEVSIFISWADTEGVIGSWVDACCLDLEDVRGDDAFWGDAHIAMHNREGQFSTARLSQGTDAATWKRKSQHRKG